MSDLFEEFEFKPLTEGLGFHKKAEKMKTDAKTRVAHDSFGANLLSENLADLLGARREDAATARPVKKSLTDLISSLPKSLDFLETKTPSEPAHIFQPLAREEYATPLTSISNPGAHSPAATPAAAAAPMAARQTEFPAPGTKAGSLFSSIPAVPTVSYSRQSSKRSSHQRRLEESFTRSFPHAEKMNAENAAQIHLTAVPASLGSGLLDALVVAGFSTIMLVCILAITKINLVALLNNATTDSTARFNLALLFVAVLQMYMLVARSFFGATLGEWAFDMQLGGLNEQTRGVYPFKVAWRTLIMTVTGLVVLPLLSLVFRKDLGAKISGVQLYRHS